MRRYNFTVIENFDETDQDVAIDPEMLGKIFEELVTERHETGAYYTPRPVVSFMCREALKGYLSSNGIELSKAAAVVDKLEPNVLSHDETGLILSLLERVEVVDPACGSGAYLLGMFKELYDLIQRIERRLKAAGARELYDIKLDLIQHNLYGVDIAPFAVNIARLRLWLSLAVEYEGDDPEPLPNLDYRIEVGDSLLAPSPTASSVQLDLFREADILEIDKLKIAFGRPPKVPEEVRQKEELRRRIDQIRNRIREPYGPVTGPDITFDWRVDFVEVFNRPTKSDGDGDRNKGGKRGFDIVLANPPYVRADAQFKHLLGADFERVSRAEQGNRRIEQNSAISQWKEYRETLKKSEIYETLFEKWDLYIPFLERAYQLLAPNGHMVFIISDSYNGNKYADKSHEFFLASCSIDRIDFCSQIPLFKAKVSNTIVHFSKGKAEPDHIPIRVRRWGETANDFTKNAEELDQVSQLDGQSRIFRPNAEKNTDRSIGYIPLSRLCYISKGAVLHGNERSAHRAFKLDDLVSPVKDRTHPVRLFLGKDMGSWVINSTSWLEYGTARAPSLFSRPTFPQLYDVPAKLVSMDLSGSTLRTVYDDMRCWHNHSAFSFVPWVSLKGIRNSSIKKTARYRGESRGSSKIPIPRETLEELSRGYDILYILGLMNSEFARQWMNKERRNKMHVYPDDWRNFPVKTIEASGQQTIARLVRSIIDKKRAESDADVSALEAEINDRVEFLYFHQVGEETYDQWKARLAAEAGTEIGAVRAMIERGETSTVEFKQSLEYVDPNSPEMQKLAPDVRAKKLQEIQKEVVKSALKSVCGFLNAAGGTLLVGVHDKLGAVGIEPDYELISNPKDKNPDGWERKFRNLLDSRLNLKPVGMLEFTFPVIDGKTVARIDVKRSAAPYYLDNVYYVRDGNRTIVLDAHERDLRIEKQKRGE